MKPNATLGRLVTVVLFLAILLSGTYFSSTPTAVYAEGGAGAPIPGDTCHVPDAGPEAPSEPGNGLFWMTVWLMISSIP